MKTLHHRLLFALLLLVLTLGPSAFAQITPSQDSYTDTSKAATNFGAATTLGVASSTASLQNTYIQFDLSSIPAGYTSANVAKATLKLYVNSVTTAGTFNVDFVNGSWSEKSMTADLAPALGTTIASNVPVSSASVHDYILVDVTAAVGDWLNGSPANDGIALVANSGLTATFDSKENTTQSHPAELDIVFTAGGSISGVTTASGSGLTGGGTSGTLNLSLQKTCSSKQILQWSGSAWVCASVGTGTVGGSGTLNFLPIWTNGSTISNSILSQSGNTMSVGGSLNAVSLSGNGSGVTNVNALSLGGLSSTAFAQLGASSNAFSGGVSAASFTGSGAGLTNVNAATLGGSSASSFAQTGAANKFVADQFFAGNGMYMYVGDPGCGPGYAALGFNGLSGCTNYSMIGNGIDTAVNRPAGGTLYFREGNGNEVVIQPGGRVGINTTTPVATLEVDGLTSTFGDVAGYFVGGTATQSGNSGNTGVAGFGGTGDVDGGYGVYGQGGTGGSAGGVGIGAFPGPNGNWAAYLAGNVDVTGSLSKSGGSFKIDHPLDPANKYLYHSFVESPDMMNIYNGNATLDGNGEAVVDLPDWFETLNRDFRYQLTSIGGFAPVYVAQKVQNNSFKIAGGRPGIEVSWQVTGIRQDAWANAHRIQVEVDKPERERGYYIHPELYGAPEEKQIEWARHPEMMKRMKERAAKVVATKKP